MKALKISTNDEVTIIGLQKPLHRTLQEELGGYFEIVRPQRLASPFCMIVDEDGLSKGLPVNQIGSLLYETDRHGSPIVGDIIIMALQSGPDGFDITGLSNSEAAGLETMFRQMAEKLREPLSAGTE